MRQNRSWASRAVRVAGVVMLAAGAVAAPTPAAGQEGAPEAVVEVDATQIWTPTGIPAATGDVVAVEASGTVSLGDPPIHAMAPAGLVRGPQCDEIAGPDAQWPAPELPCWSLIARVGDAPAVFVGAATEFTSSQDGELFLGVNDNHLGDNAGSWSAVVRVVPAPVTGGTGAGPAVPGATAAPGDDEPLAVARDGDGDGALPLVPVAAAALVALAVAALVVRARRAREPEFALPPSLRVGRVAVGIRTDRVIRRLDAHGEEQLFAFSEDDFAPLGVHGTHPVFVWHGLELRAIRGRGLLRKAYGEVSMSREYVAGSGGVVLGPDGFTRGHVPLELPGAWVFALGSVGDEPKGDEGDRPSVDGHVTAFVRADQPFAAQVDAIVDSFGSFLADLDWLLARRTPRATGAGGARRR